MLQWIFRELNSSNEMLWEIFRRFCFAPLLASVGENVENIVINVLHILRCRY